MQTAKSSMLSSTSASKHNDLTALKKKHTDQAIFFRGNQTIFSIGLSFSTALWEYLKRLVHFFQVAVHFTLCHSLYFTSNIFFSFPK